MKLKTSEYQGILIGQIVIGIIGGLFLLLDDFAGWYHGAYYYEEWGDIYFGSGFITSILLFAMTLLLFRSAYSAIKIVKAEKVDSEILKSHANSSQRNGIIVAGTIFIGGLVFVISNILDETSDWWLDNGFNAGLIAGIAFIFFARLILNKIKKK